MKRLLIAILAAVTSLAAWALPAPEAATGVIDDLLELPETGQRSAVWFCPGVDGDTDPILMASLLSPGLVGFSLPADGEILDAFQARIEPGVGDWDLGDGLFFHPGPSIVETSSIPSAPAAVYRGPAQVAATGCYTPAKEWFLNGATSGPAENVILRLFNPLLEQGQVSLEVVTEFGFEPLLDLQSLSIGPRDWEDVPLTLMLGSRQQVAVRVTVTEGVVIPSLSVAGPKGLAVWPGESPSATWELPLAQVAGTQGTIAVWNPGTEHADVSIELVGRQGPIGVFDLAVGPGREERFDVSAITSLEVGAVVSSPVAVVSAVRSEGLESTAGSQGTPRPATRWVVSGHGITPDLASYIFVLNSGDEPVEVEAGAVGSDPEVRIEVSAHAIARLDVSGRGAEIVASGPVSVAWVLVGEADVGLSLGVPLAAAGR